MSKTPNADKKPVKTPRKLKTGSYKSFKLQKPIKTAGPKLPSSFKLLKGTLGVMRRNWKTFLGIILIYGVMNLLLVQSFNASDINQTKENLDGLNQGSFGSLLSSTMLFVYMASSSGNINNSTAGAYQLFLTLITSLALIWTLREIYAGNKVRIRDGFYWGMYPLIPFLLVGIVALSQMLPVVVAGYLHNLVSSGIAATGAETVLWGVAFGIFGLMTLYMLASSLFALYIVCLPDMQPMAALRSARELVRYRRWTIMRKLLFLPIFLLVAGGVLIIPLIYIAAPLASITFLLTSMFGLPIIHGYMYRLYRELL
ncbi:MAG TPA: hypothetical protein VFT16_04380 [Candidatus Saccharimonadales bacterium]|nr:hypothetical protein [Candidatus Saccharimonadales bacterium]